MKNRIVIEKLNDGHVIVDQQQLSNVALSGNAHQRKQAKLALQKGEIQQAWRKVDRTIFRSGVVEQMPAFPSGVEILPFGSAEIADIAGDNSAVALEGADFAQQMAWAINKQNAAFVVKPPRRMRVVFVDEDEHIERSSHIDPLEYL
jgi:hypothetical protein